MRRFLSAALVVGARIALASPLGHEQAEPNVLRARNIVDSISDAYDFVVVGGGLAGLVLGARLSEDANHTVLVLESGGNGDEFRERIDTPAYAYYESLWPTELNWDFETVPQPACNDRKHEWPRGKVLGGSSAINGLYMNRPGQIEVDAWKDMLGDMNGAEHWSWDSFFAAMKKSETFHPPTDAMAQDAALAWDAASHGTDGPIHHAWPGYTFPYVSQWITSAAAAGVEATHDSYGGLNPGAYVSLSCINPANWTRSYSRSGYLDPLPPRKNYDVLANAHVTRILFNSSSPANNLSASAVEYTRDGGATKLTVKVNKEVILAGGSVGSPAVLLYSGVGPKDVLSAAGVPLVSELPGVGRHLQDHLSVSLEWSTDEPTGGSMYEDKDPKATDPVFLSFVNDAIAYLNAAHLFGDGANDMHSSIVSNIDGYAPQAGADVVAGYKAIYETTANKIFTSTQGLVELLIGNNVNGAIRIGAAIQHPYSQGRIYINSNNPVDYPIIDPNYLAHPADVQALREGLKIARRIGETSPLSGQMKKETWPGEDVQTDQEWDDWLRDNTFTEFHPSSTCAMLPREQGGVVDANLRVYGLANVRVADASVPPISFSAHLMGSTYGIAEQASTIIRNFHNRKAPPKVSPVVDNSKNSTTVSSDTTDTDQPESSSPSSDASSASPTENGATTAASLASWAFFGTIAGSIALALLA